MNTPLRKIHFHLHYTLLRLKKQMTWARHMAMLFFDIPVIRKKIQIICWISCTKLAENKRMFFVLKAVGEPIGY